MEHYDTPEWQPYLIVAAAGAVFVLLALVFMVVQIAVSIKRRAEYRDWTGDPWSGLTLEWLTSSPPAPYNFAVIPEVRDRDAFLDMKERGVAWQRPARYEDILMPRNSAFGPVLGGLAFVFGFAVVWYIWWLAVLAAGLIALWIAVRSSNDDTDYVLSAAEVEAIENRRFADLARAPAADVEDTRVAFPRAVLTASAS
jgi:cytochrome o ubiquinol oxidase subunit 1